MKHNQFIKLLAVMSLLMAAATFIVARPATPAVANDVTTDITASKFIGADSPDAKPRQQIVEAICDDMDSSCFSQQGSGWGWINGNSSYNNHAWWTHGNGTGDWAKWTPNLPQDGDYDVYIWYPHYPGSYPETNTARYQVHAHTGDTSFIVNQAINFGGWQKLTTVCCIAGTECYAKVTDVTNEGFSRRVWFDATKFTRTGPASCLTSSISGQIKDTTGNGVANIVLLTAAGYAATTDINGNYTINNLTSNTYNITPTTSGRIFNPDHLAVTVPPSAIGKNFILDDLPTLNSITSPDTDGNYSVTWSSVSGATSYTLETDDNTGFNSPTAVYTGGSTTYNEVSQTHGTWYYRVKASNNGGDTIWSSSISVTVVSYVTSLTSFTGPTTGSTNTSRTYNVTVSPVTATFPITYTWQATGLAPIVHVVSSTTDSVTFNWPTPGDKLVSVSVTNGGAPVSTGQNVTVYAPPQANFVRQPATALVNQTIYVTNTSVGSYTTMLYDFGDGTVSSLSNVTHNYAATGTKIIMLTVSGYGLNSTFTQSVNIVEACVPSFTVTPMNGVVPLTVTLTDSSSGDCATTTWNFGDGSATSSVSNPTHSYNLTGTFTIVLTHSGTGGIITATESVQIFPRARADFTADKVTGETPLQVCFTNISQNYTGFSWTFGDGSAADNLTANPCHNYTVGGSYTVTLTVTGLGVGNSATKTMLITPTTTLKPLFTVSPPSGIAPAQLCFINGSTPLDATSSWNFGDGSGLDSSRNPCHTYLTANNYTVILTLTTAKNSAMTSATVSVYQKCAANFSFSPNPVLVGQTVQVTNTTTGNCNIASLNWGDGTSNSQLTHVYTQAGTYSMTLAMQGNGGPDQFITQITVSPLTQPQITANPPSGDAPLTVQFGLVDKGSSSPQWNFGDNTVSSSSNPVHTFFTPNIYLVKVTLTGPLGTVVISRPITVTTPPMANFKLSPMSGLTPLDVIIDNTSTGDIASYRWDLGNGQTFADKVPPPQTYSTGIYSITLTVTGVSGQVSRHQETVTVYDPCVADFAVIGAIQAELPPLQVNVSNISQHCTEFYWEFGDGAVSDFIEPDHLYTRAGKFTLKLIATGPVNSSPKDGPVIEVGDPLCQVAQVQLAPINPLDNDDLTVSYNFGCTQRQQAAEGVRLQWLQNGQPVPKFDLITHALQVTLPASATTPFDKWKVALTPYKGSREGTTVESNEVYIQQKPNTPPTATVTIAPAVPLDDANLTLTYRYFDADGDAEQTDKVQLFWLLANQLQPAYTAMTVPMDATNPQETWCATVRVNDGQEYGPTAPLSCVTIGTGKNHPPQILSPTMTVQRQLAGHILRVTGIYSDVDLPCAWCGKKVESLPQTTMQWFRTESPHLVGVLQPEFNNQTEISRSVTITSELWYATLQLSDGIDASAIVQTQPMVEILPPDKSNTPPIVENVRIVPLDTGSGRKKSGDPVDSDNLYVDYDFHDNDGQPEQSSLIYWYNSLTHVVQYDGQRLIPNDVTQQNQTWYVRVMPCDGKDCGQMAASDSVQIRPDPYNSAPSLENLRLVPTEPGITDALELAYQFKDLDQGDSELGTQIRWTNNGKLKPALDDKSKVRSDLLDEGDTWCVEVRPADQLGAQGKWYGPLCVTIKASSVNRCPTAEQVYISAANLPHNQSRKPADGENLELHYNFMDRDCAPSAYKTCEHNSEIRWSQNGVNQAAFDNLTIISATTTLPGDSWSATLRPHDGQCLGDKVTPLAVVINHQPELSGVSFTPMSPTPALTLTATCAYNDADGDAPSLLAYRWSRDGVPIPQYDDQASLAPQALHEGETWTVTCTAHDGIESGNTMSGTVKIGAIRVYLPLIIKQQNGVEPTATASTPTTPTATPVAFEQQPVTCNPSQNYEPNNSRTDICPIQLNQTYTAYPNDRYDYYSFALTETLSVKGEITGYTEGNVRIYNSFDGRDTMIEWQLKGDTTIPNAAIPYALVNLAPGRYTLLIDTATLSTNQPYQLTLTALPKRP